MRREGRVFAAILALSLLAVIATRWFAPEHAPTKQVGPETHVGSPVLRSLLRADSLATARGGIPSVAALDTSPPLSLDDLFNDSGAPRARGGPRHPRHATEPRPVGSLGDDEGEVRAALQRAINDAFDEAVDLTRDYALRKPIDLHYGECDKSESAFYERATRRVTLCAALVRQVYRNAMRSDALHPVDQTQNVIRFVVAHEIGHALIDILRLPVLGRSEDAADQFATMQFLTHGRASPVIAAASNFTTGSGADRTDLGDEHALDGQRAANLVCWLYGHDSSAFSTVAEIALPSRRRAGCAAEYANLAASWSRLLRPFGPRE